VPRLVNRALIAFQAAELAIARHVRLPFGLTIMLVARKPVPIRAPLAAIEDGVPVRAVS
jgi:hypothetical protein